MNSHWWRNLAVGPFNRDAGGDADGAQLSTAARPAVAGRGQAISADSGGLRSRMGSLAGVALLALLCVGFLGWYYSHDSRRSRPEDVHTRPPAAKGDFVLPPLNLPAPTKVAPESLQPSVTAEDTAYAVGNVLDDLAKAAGDGGRGSALPTSGGFNSAAIAPLPATTSRKSRRLIALERRLDATLLVRKAVGTIPANVVAGTSAAIDATGAALPAASGAHPAAAAHGISDLLQTSHVAMAQADVLPTQQLLLPKGAFIDCTLETAIDSTLPGMVTCITPLDTYSADGTVVLLERGTKLIGETRGEVQQGSSRVFVLWSEARTPLGIIVPLASPGTDELGRSGLPGEANHHFFERFGAAILVSVIDGAVQAAANSRSQGSSGSTIVLNPSGTQDVMTEVLRNTISVPTTIRKPQGDRIQILVARDLDFRSVYQLRLR